jgi:GNAT superfamily N-acetyltransferase
MINDQFAVKSRVGFVNPLARRVTLHGVSSAVVRPIRPDDGPRLAEGMQQLSPESRRRRFLFSKGSLSPAELDYFTHCDGIHHLALVLVETDPEGREHQLISVARCVRDATDASLAEVAIVVADDQQHHGVGEILIKALANSAWEAGIRCWSAILFSNNVAMRKLLELVGKKQSEQSEGADVISLVYRLSRPPVGGELPFHNVSVANS